jgi:hypothetical protein
MLKKESAERKKEKGTPLSEIRWAWRLREGGMRDEGAYCS